MQGTGGLCGGVVCGGRGGRVWRVRGCVEGEGLCGGRGVVWRERGCVEGEGLCGG